MSEQRASRQGSVAAGANTCLPPPFVQTRPTPPLTLVYLRIRRVVGMSFRTLGSIDELMVTVSQCVCVVLRSGTPTQINRSVI